MAFNTRSIFKLLLTSRQNTVNTFKSPSTCTITTRNITWQNNNLNAIRRIVEKEQGRKRRKKDGQNTMEKSKIIKLKFLEKSGIKTSKLKEILNKKGTSNKNKKKLIEEEEQNKYTQDLSRQIQLHKTSRLNKRSFLLQMINRKCNPNLSPINSTSSSRKKRTNLEEISSSLSSDNDKIINYDLNWREKENLPGWLRHRFSMKERIGFKEWRPHKRVNREIMDKIRLLYDKSPEEFNTEKLSNHFKISPESIRRILKSKFIPNSEMLERQERKYKEKLMKFKEEQKEKKEQNKRKF